jgi:hypothetical protein
MQISKVIRVIFTVLANVFVLMEYIYNHLATDEVTVYYFYSYAMDIVSAVSSFCILLGVVFLVSVLRSSFDKVKAQVMKVGY